MSAFLGFLWCFQRIFIRSPSGRQRFNVLAALHAITHETITVCNDAYINAACVCELLRKIKDAYSDIMITLVMDNARYQRCKIVIELANELGIEIMFLPPYSPNLNLIERLWKFVKKKCLYSKRYENFTAFKEAIYGCISNAHVKHKEELDTLLTLNFQTFKKEQIMAA